jgi:uncharacterized protein YkwD
MLYQAELRPDEHEVWRGALVHPLESGVQRSSTTARSAEAACVVMRLRSRRSCAALLALAIVAVPATARASDRCEDADALPGQVSQARLRASTLCLMNAERGARGLARLQAEPALARVAGSYARQMVRERFFDHTSPGGSTMMSRVRSSRYLHDMSSWSVGENLAWGSGTLATPRATVRAWMRSADHRANLLDPRFRDAGIGVAEGAPEALGPDEPGGTYVTDFGRRVRG